MYKPKTLEKDETTYRILLVEDEAALRKTIQLNLELEGYEVFSVEDGGDAAEAIKKQRFDLIILDVMLPTVDGFTICKSARLEGNTTPVLMLSAKSSPQEKVEGLKAGADDYMGKPFHLEELLIRISKLIIRKDQRTESISELEQFEFDGGSVNFKRYEITTHDGEKKVLSKKEVMLLKLLIQKEGEVVSREEILEAVWGYDVFPSTRTIDNYILSFRKYFEVLPKEPKHIFSVRGVGYKFLK